MSGDERFGVVFHPTSAVWGDSGSREHVGPVCPALSQSQIAVLLKMNTPLCRSPPLLSSGGFVTHSPTARRRDHRCGYHSLIMGGWCWHSAAAAPPLLLRKLV